MQGGEERSFASKCRHLRKFSHRDNTVHLALMIHSATNLLRNMKNTWKGGGSKNKKFTLTYQRGCA